MRRRTLCALACGIVAASCGREAPPPPVDSGAGSAPLFVEAAEASGLDVTHFNGMSGEFYLAEIMGAGVGVIDYDGDGDLDVYAVQGQMLGKGRSPAQATFPPPAAAAARDRLFRNDLRVDAAGVRTLHFTDVTDRAGIDVRSYGMGVAAGDVDNDGWTDLLLTRLDSVVLLHNNGNGTFSDVSARSGIVNAGWGVSASFLDYDRDGWLDLYVGNYLTYSVDADADCVARSGAPDYCAPATYRPGSDRLFRNRRDGTFDDVTARARIAGPMGPAMGVVAADVNGDGWPDIYVANDAAPNVLWLNQEDGTFRNAGLASGAALSADGQPEGSMGVDAGDVDNDGDDDLVMTNIAGEGHDLYANDGMALFEDRSGASGLTVATLPFTGFGAGLIDYDNDGWLDLFTVNGAVHVLEELARAGDRFPLHQRKQLLRNLQDGRFEDVSARAGAAFSLSEVGRGAAFGDIDNDGDADVVVSNNSGRLRLFLNQVGRQRHWVGLRLLTPEGRDALGARVAVRQGATTRWRHAHADGSYGSASDPRVLVGLGESAGAMTVRVMWPDGRTDDIGNVQGDRWTTLRERPRR